LVAILRSNLGGGQNQPKVWLTYMPWGEVTHTFVAERGVVGGAMVAFFAHQGGNVFTTKRDEVVSWLTSFGLNRREAQEIVARVGTAP